MVSNTQYFHLEETDIKKPLYSVIFPSSLTPICFFFSLRYQACFCLHTHMVSITVEHPVAHLFAACLISRPAEWPHMNLKVEPVDPSSALPG